MHAWRASAFNVCAISTIMASTRSSFSEAPLLFNAAVISSASSRLINFNHEFIAPPKFIFQVTPGNSQITKGDDLLITVKVKGAKLKNISLSTKSEDQTSFEIENLTADSLGDFHLEEKTVRNSFKYFAEAENIKSDVFTIDVIDHPIIKNLDVKVISPSSNVA